MTKLWQNIKREPVRWLAGLQVLWVAVVSGLLVFEAWSPSADQLQWTLGVPVVLANIFGFTVVREAVTPNEKLSDAVVERARDAGQSTVTLIVLIVLVVLAFFGAAHIFGWNLN